MTKRKESHSRETVLETAFKNSIAYKLTQTEQPDEKRALVTEHNPTHYIFGEHRRAWKPWLTYQENMEVQYIGERA